MNTAVNEAPTFTMKTAILCLIFLGVMQYCTSVAAQSTASLPIRNIEVEVVNVQQVLIQAEKNPDNERRRSTAAKIVIDRDELDKYGDGSIGDILKRMPGVTVGGRPGRGGDIRMRGLGSGYTQILLNGERAPRGFSIESLTPDQIERIEIIRGAVAEFSTQAIAGTINIILREDLKQASSDVKIGISLETHRTAPNFSINIPREHGQLSYLFNLTVSKSRVEDSTETETIERNGLGELKLHQKNLEDFKRVNQQIHLAPRLTYKYTDGSSLNIQPFFSQSRSESSNIGTLNELSRATDWQSPVGFHSAHSQSNSQNNLARLQFQFQQKYSNGSRLHVRASANKGRQDASSIRRQYGINGNLLNTIIDLNNNEDQGLGFGGKYSFPIGEQQSLAWGWEYDRSLRVQKRDSTNNGIPQFAESGDSLDAETERKALFVQDEFDIFRVISVYVGGRWESVKTKSTTKSGPRPDVENESGVFSPLVHAVWRFDENKKDQLRASLTNSYKAPALNDLIAIPTISNLNSPTRPDRTGNPNLKPELSRGFDLAYEHYFSGQGVVSLNFFYRRVSNLIRRRVLLQDTGIESRWVSSPINITGATTKGLEFEAKFPINSIVQINQNLDARFNYSKFHSLVDDIHGPNNRLDQQPDQTANFGLDYRDKTYPITLSINANWTPSYETRSSNLQTVSNGVKRQIDLQAIWKFSADHKLRVAINNLQSANFDTKNNVSNSTISATTYQSAKTYRNLSLRFESKI